MTEGTSIVKSSLPLCKPPRRPSECIVFLPKTAVLETRDVASSRKEKWDKSSGSHTYKIGF